MSLTKFIDELPLPSVLKGKKVSVQHAIINKKKQCDRDYKPEFTHGKGFTFYKIKMKQIKQKLHTDLPETTLWGYEGLYPGPTIEVKVGEKVKVLWENNLPKNHLLPVDTTVHGAQPDNPTVRTVVHLHGASVAPESDGHPEAWFTKNFKKIGPEFTRKIYEYKNKQRATTLWYHDHALGITRLNVYTGLAGFYIIRDPMEKSLRLPKGKYEIPLVIQDRSFNLDGSLFYPAEPDPPVGVFPSIVPEFFGDTILVNGKVWPFLRVEPRKYRFRILNGSNSRFYNLMMSSNQTIYQIGNEGGLFENPVALKQLILAPAERADVIIDFRNCTNQNIILANDANAPFPNGDSVDPNTTGQIMQFRVDLPLSCPDKSQIPFQLSEIEVLEESKAVEHRDLTLIEDMDEFGRMLLLLNGMMWHEPITEKPKLNTIEVWNLINLTIDTHPIHLHLVHFQILDRQPFDVAHYTATGEILTTGPAIPPDSNEKSWKDTVRANPGEITRIIARFGPFTGVYPWHCHILEHEDHDMMRPFEVVR